MKTILFLFFLLVMGSMVIQAQNTWTQKASFGGTARLNAVGFSIGSKGYIGTGYDSLANFRKDFWEYDPATNAWTQKADFGGTARELAVGFSMGNKGYIGTGSDYNTGLRNDFWEYNPASNAWTQKANFGGTARYRAVGFSIGNKGYIGNGVDVFNGIVMDFWEYDPGTDSWTPIANSPGPPRYNRVAFSIGNKGYVGTGTGQSGSQKQFWEYDPANNTWAQKANFGGSGREKAVGFSIGNKGYIGTGVDGQLSYKNDFWEYDPASNTWTQKANFGGTGRMNAAGFSIGNKGYVGTGYSGGPNHKKDFWEYSPDECNTPGGLSTSDVTASSATLQWMPVMNALKYKVRYKVSGSNNWSVISNVNASSLALSELSAGTSYTWQVSAICGLNPTVSSSWSAKKTFTTALRLASVSTGVQNSVSIYPNPATDQAIIHFTLTQSSHVSIRIYDVSGKDIGKLCNNELSIGDHSYSLSLAEFPKGVYIMKMISGSEILTRKLIVQ